MFEGLSVLRIGPVVVSQSSRRNRNDVTRFSLGSESQMPAYLESSESLGVSVRRLKKCPQFARLSS